MSSFDANKRQWLQRQQPIRLPWALDEQAFTDGCTRCDACIEACPELLIFKGRGGFPALDFQQNECTFCGLCVDACQQPIFRRRSEPAFLHHAEIDARCFPLHGIACRSCGEVCEVEAIHFQFGANRMALPQIDTDICNGCGACLSVCPAEAIQLNHNEVTA